MTNLRVARQTKEEMTLSRKGKFFDYSLLIVVLFLIAFGLVMIYSTSSYSGLQAEGDSAFYFKKQIKATLIGLVFMGVATVINYRVWYKIAPVIYIGSIVSILLVLTPLGMTLNGARRWIGIGGFSIQPAEIMKLGLIISLAAFITYSGKNMKKGLNTLVFILMVLLSVLLIYVITDNLSTAIILLGIGYVMLLISKPNIKWILIITGVLIAVVVVAIIVFFNIVDESSEMGFRLKRILAWKNPEKYASGVGYQTIQALYAIGSGGFFGKGLGNSIQKLGFIPEAQNDMIFSVICEELGLFGAICLIILFVIMIWRFMVIANNSQDLFGSMIVVGVLAHISIQVILNIAVVTNTIPNTGITLPFISYGGTSVLFLMVEMGIVLNVSTNIRVPVPVDKMH